MTNKTPPDYVLKAYEKLGPCEEIKLINMGLINNTWLIITKSRKYILQEVSAIFDTTIHDDAWAVCAHVAPQGLLVPRIIPDNNNNLFLSYSGKIFRALEYISGGSFHKIQNLTMAEQAGIIIGKFHASLVNFNYEYLSKRRQAGDFNFHATNLKQALEKNTQHEYYSRINKIALDMLENMTLLALNFSSTKRHIHGDPKISNIIFDTNYHACALIDFDTLNNSGWSLEIADALRSWCNPNEEDILEAYVDLEIAQSALAGYGETIAGRWTEQEHDELIIAMQAITLCLSMRYLADVVNESYWAYDSTRFVRPADHNLLRAQAMFNLFQDFKAKKSELKTLIKRYL
jgi:Ser/Thr protein kinase RdoA (MazF antagonist)